MGGLNCRPGYLCAVWSCQLVAIEKSDFIHVPSECQWRNSLTRAGIRMTLWMASHKKGKCLGRRGLWTIIDWTGERGNGRREVEDGKYEGKKKGDEARVASLWARKGRRPGSPRTPEASLAAIDLYTYLWLSHLPFPPPGLLWVSENALRQENLFSSIFLWWALAFECICCFNSASVLI